MVMAATLMTIRQMPSLTPLGSAGDYAGIESLLEISPEQVSHLSDAADASVAQGDLSPKALSVIKESPKVVVRHVLPPSVAGVSLLSPTS